MVPKISLKIGNSEFPIYVVIVWAAIAMLWFVLIDDISLGEEYQFKINLPYWVYELLRAVVSVAAVVLILQGFTSKHLWILSVGISALFLFNPFVPLHLPKTIWKFIDFTMALLFSWTQDSLNHTIFIKKGEKKSLVPKEPTKDQEQA